MWIPTPGGQVFAGYHPPARESVRRSAVLLCDPFGWHRMVLHATYREIALRLSTAGFPVLRVDYPGTCDSEGTPRQVARLDTWLAGLDAAADVLKIASGATQLALFGALLGGSLAVMFAGRRSDVTTLVLWGAYLQGRTAVRTEIAAATAATPIPQNGLPPGGVAGDREAFGFLLTAEFIDDMRRVDLLGAAVPSARRALVLPRAATPTDSKRLAEHLANAGVAVELRETSLDDLEAILHSAGAGHPKATIDDIATWLERQFPELDTAPATRAPGPTEVVLPIGGTRVREAAVFFGAHGGLFGIISEPIGLPVREPAVVLVSGGRNHRSGINRNYTEWARKLASLGHRVLRIDLRGLGDSPLGPRRRRVLYSREGRHDVLDAVAWLNERGAERVACVGLCAGSYQAFPRRAMGTVGRRARDAESTRIS